MRVSRPQKTHFWTRAMLLRPPMWRSCSKPALTLHHARTACKRFQLRGLLCNCPIALDYSSPQRCVEMHILVLDLCGGSLRHVFKLHGAKSIQPSTFIKVTVDARTAFGHIVEQRQAWKKGRSELPHFCHFFGQSTYEDLQSWSFCFD